jgi:hypothetical protein
VFALCSLSDIIQNNILQTGSVSAQVSVQTDCLNNTKAHHLYFSADITMIKSMRIR